MAILLKNATYIDPITLSFTQTHIIVNEGVNQRILLTNNINDLSDITETIDCSGKLVTKSFAIGHHHAYSAMAKGMPASKKSPQNFREILQYVWWTLDKCLDKESIELSALITALESAKTGSTFVIDHHASPNYIRGSLELMAKAFDRVGVNHLLCYEITDRDGMEKSKQGLDETADYLKNRQGLVGLHASFTVGDDTLKQSVELMNQTKTGIHVHVAEDLYDQEHCQEHYKKRVIERFHDAGVLESEKTILVHNLHLEQNERQLVAKSPCWVAQNAESNMNNNVGYFNGKDLGPRIMIGTDGMHSDILQSAKAAFFVGQRFDNIDYPSSYERFRNVHKYLNSNHIKGDGENNLVVLDYATGTEINQGNFLGHFIFGLRSNHVEHVISNGKVIVKNRIITQVNEADILQEAQARAKDLWKRMKTL
ncbi:MAG: amidohydrolase family protein [Salinivirgaceae bacterium]|nr:amidohydrolase family protein [Salinivirgaceae bacterium]